MSTNTTMPAIFLPHGEGPWPWMPEYEREYVGLAKYLQQMPSLLPETPRALVVISAHWEAPKVTAMTSKAPPMLYDY